MSKRESDAVAAILADPENDDRTAEEVAERCIMALDDIRARTHRLAVVGQLFFEGDAERHTVILGPFSSVGILDAPEKFARVIQGGSAARQAGQDLAWDTKTGKSRGRFLLAPAFQRPRDAWDFFRPGEPPNPRHLRITESIARWSAGKWAQERPIRPVCHCGMIEHPRRTSTGDMVGLGPCPRHAA